MKRRAAVNWCPACKTVLANEQVIGGYCERHPDVKVEQRLLDQWFFTITKYAAPLLDNLETADWSHSTKTIQANWIGRSEGAELVFETPAGKRIAVFTTRPDTLFGATYLVLAPEHPLVADLTTAECRADVNAYRRRVAAMDLVSRKSVEKAKTGVFTGSYARNPATGASVPIWIADYVLMEYGTGAIMAVPGHDERDFEFAVQMKLPIVRVVAGPGQDAATPLAAAEADDPGGEAGQQPRLRREAVGGGEARHHGGARGEGTRETGHQLPAPRLVHLPPALLGAADPDHLLRRLRHGAGAGAGSPGRPSGARGLPPRRLGRLAAGARGVVVPGAVPASAGSSRGARPTSPTPSSTRRGTSCAIRPRTGTTCPSTRRSRRSGCRSPRTSAATSTPSCT